MSSPHYLGGSGPVYGAFFKQTITGNSSAKTFALTYRVPSAAALLVVKNGSILNPSVDFTIGSSASTIVFTAAPSGIDVVYLIYLGTASNTTPSTTANAVADNFTGNGTDTDYTLSAAPYTIDNLIVFIDGVCQIKIVNYTVADNVLSFTSAPDNGANIMVFQIVSQVALSWTSIDSSTTAVQLISNGKYLIDANSAGTTATLPSSPSVGDTMKVVNMSASNYDVTVARNGLKIDGGTTNITLTAYGNKVELVYSGSTQGWVTVDS